VVVEEVIASWLEIETWVIGKGGTNGGAKGGTCVGGALDMDAAGFCGPCVFCVYFHCCGGRCLCQGLQGLGVCTVGTVGLSMEGECAAGGVVW
jgi:hypothetical protein